MDIDVFKGRKDLTPVVIDREFNLKDLFLYRIKEHGLCIVKGIVEGYRDQLSMVEWIDFLLDDKRLRNNVSYVEKRILSSFYRVKPTPILYFTLTFEDCSKCRSVFKNIENVKITTAQWFSWDAKLTYGHGNIFDLLNTYCKVLPSSYKPPLYILRSPMRSLNIIYYNSYSSVRYRLKHINLPDLKHEEGRMMDILYPPNLFGVGDDPINYLHVEYKDVVELDEESILRKYRMIVSRFNDFNGRMIFPIFKVSGDVVKVGYIVREAKKIKFHTPVYEGESYVIDQNRRYTSSKKFVVYFKDFWSRISKKGYALQINMKFREYKSSGSRIYPSLLYGGKVYYSSSSRPGYKIL